MRNEQRTERRVEQGVIGVLAFSMLGLATTQIGRSGPLDVALMLLLPIAAGALIYAGWQGWRWTRHCLVLVTSAMIATMLPEPFLSRETSYLVLLGPALAVVLLGPRWPALSAILTLSILIGRAGGQGVYTQPAVIVILGMVVGLLVLAQLLTAQARRSELGARVAAEEAQQRAEAEAARASETADRLEDQVIQQQRLLDLVATLETPAIQIADRVLLTPVVGYLDDSRATALTSRLLRAAHVGRASVVILDVAGVTELDTTGARAIINAVQALKLIGCAVVISGISSTTANTLTSLGVSLSGISVARSPQDALEQLAEQTETYRARRNN